jgi:hypothetical protein
MGKKHSQILRKILYEDADSVFLKEEKETKAVLNIKLNAKKSDHIIVGVRLRLAGSKRSDAY